MTSGPLVIDASVFVKVFLNETGTAAARALLGSGVGFLAPEHLGVEAASAITRRVRVGWIVRPEAEVALDDVRALLTRFALTPDRLLLPRAEAMALDLGHPLKDCLYLALAEREGCEVITADQTFIVRAAPHFPFIRAL